MATSSTSAIGSTPRGVLRVGPAGWSYDDWKGVVYPQRPGRGFDALSWISRLFDLVEVNVSFYRLVRPAVVASWVERTEDSNLEFAVKLPSTLTHTREIDAELVARFDEMVRPLIDAGRLNSLLAQFPWSFRPSAASVAYLRQLAELFSTLPVNIEVRHADWATEEWLAAVSEVQPELRMVSVDQPVVRNNLDNRIFNGEHLYLRMHGRNNATWFSRDAGRDQRYDYMYSENEVKSWVQRLNQVIQERSSVVVVTNNHFEGQAVANALEIDALLGRPSPWIPAGLYKKHPGLKERFASIGFEPEVIEDARELTGEKKRDPKQQGELF